MSIDLRLGDCLDVLRTLPDNSVDSIVTDPPYGLSFMNKKWDYDVPTVEIWEECLRVLKPGGHLLSFAGSRTYHRMAVRIEDAGFEIRDQIMWVYASGFPKSHNIGKAIDKIQGNEREVIGDNPNHRKTSGLLELGFQDGKESSTITKGNSEWEGWGTALKPAHEPIVMARKPLSEKSIAENVLKWGTGGINIDDCRIDGEGRFPANIMFDEEAGKLLDEQSGFLKSGKMKGKYKNTIFQFNPGVRDGKEIELETYGDSGGASRFFYCPKVSKKERNAGLEDMPETTNGQKGHGLDRICGNCGTKMLKPQDCKCEEPDWITPPKKNTHPTVKPIKLMEYLITLVTPNNGVILDPFMGSGSTGIAAKNKGFDFIGVEREEEYMNIARQRING